jgi:hypothetical protein
MEAARCRWFKLRDTAIESIKGVVSSYNAIQHKQVDETRRVESIHPDIAPLYPTRTFSADDCSSAVGMDKSSISANATKGRLPSSENPAAANRLRRLASKAVFDKVLILVGVKFKTENDATLPARAISNSARSLESLTMAFRRDKLFCYRGSMARATSIESNVMVSR